MIDYTQLVAGQTYCITGRIWWEIDDDVIIDEDDEIIVTEGKAGNPEIAFKIE